MRRRARRLLAALTRRVAALRRSADQRQREREAGMRPADLGAVLVVVVLGLLLAFALGLVLGLVLQCGI